jgi:hypothetical protein
MSLDKTLPLGSVIAALRRTFEEFGIRTLGTTVELMIPKGFYDKTFTTKSALPHITAWTKNQNKREERHFRRNLKFKEQK